MRFETRILFEIVEARERIKDSENEAKTLRLVRLYSFRLAPQEEFFETFVLEILDHFEEQL
jgi:hypothetical protein